MGVLPHSTTEPRWRRLPEERPRQILAAALEVFGEHGLASARLEDIAKRAGVSKGTIYLYFSNKEDLFRAMIGDIVVGQLEAAERAVNESTTSATETLTAFMRSYWTRIRGPQFGPLFRLIHAEIHSFPDLASFYGQEVAARSQRLIAGIIQTGIDRGEFRPMDPFVAARMLSAPFVMHGLWCSHRECFSDVAKKSDEQILQEMIDFYLYAIRPRQDTAPSLKNDQ
jgi:AcrR family transcriptional regulator